MNCSPEAIRTKMINHWQLYKTIKVVEYGKLLETVANHWGNKLFQQGPTTVHRNLSEFLADALGLPCVLWYAVPAHGERYPRSTMPLLLPCAAACVQ